MGERRIGRGTRVGIRTGEKEGWEKEWKSMDACPFNGERTEQQEVGSEGLF